MPAGTTIKYASGAEVTRSESFKIAKAKATDSTAAAEPFAVDNQQKLVLPAGVTQSVAGSSWGTFTIACTIPIALFVGLYMYKLRRGKIVEASLIGAAATIGVTIAGHWIPGSPLERYFSLSREETVLALCFYGFIASVLPVWLLLCPRDYLSSFLKIGTVILLVIAVLVASPQLKAPAINPQFSSGGPNVPGAIFPFCFICIMCGAISGFHSLVSSGTTPKMIDKESHVRMIGYGSMLIEGLVGVLALIAAASLPPGDYWAINVPLDKTETYADKLAAMNANSDNLPEIEQQVGGESLRGRTGGAVTLAVGMSEVFTQAIQRVTGNEDSADMLKGVKKYWYHFAIMFEALFILTTIDAGTRIARFLLQEVLGKIWKPFNRTDWLPGAIIATADRHVRLGRADLGRLDRYHLADVRHRQSVALRHRAGGRHIVDHQLRPRQIRPAHDPADAVRHHHHDDRRLSTHHRPVQYDAHQRLARRSSRLTQLGTRDQRRPEHRADAVHDDRRFDHPVSSRYTLVKPFAAITRN